MTEGAEGHTANDPVIRVLQWNRAELISAWQDTFGCPVPKSCRAGWLRQALAWHVQASAMGLDLGKLRRRIQRVSSPHAAPGTRLIRQWQGNTHQVTVLAEGFEYRGSVYKSLSVIARHITGTRWSGPAFFGLR